MGLSSGGIAIWDSQAERVELSLSGKHTKRVLDLIYGPPPLLLSVSADGAALVWDKRTGGVASALRAHSSPVGCGAVSVSGLAAATGDSAGNILIWDLRAPGRPRLVLIGHAGGINSVHLFEKGHAGAVLSASADWTARIWNPSSGRLEAVLAGPRTAFLCPRPLSDTRDDLRALCVCSILCGTRAQRVSFVTPVVIFSCSFLSGVRRTQGPSDGSDLLLSSRSARAGQRPSKRRGRARSACLYSHYSRRRRDCPEVES